MGWFRSADQTTFAAAGRQFEGVRAPDGFYYFDLPTEAAAHAIPTGLVPGGPPPEAHPGIDQEAMIADVTARVNQQLQAHTTEVEERLRTAIEGALGPRPPTA